MNFHLEALREDHFERLHALFDSVCREKRFLAFTQAPPIESGIAYYRQILAAGDTHFVAVRGQELIGWCDLLAQFPDARQHVGTLGMAVRPDSRGLGVGRALIQAALEHAFGRGLARIELTVHEDNHAAQALYRSVGFELEGRQRKGWCVDGRYADLLVMARLRDA